MRILLNRRWGNDDTTCYSFVGWHTLQRVTHADHLEPEFLPERSVNNVVRRLGGGNEPPNNSASGLQLISKRVFAS